MAFIEKSQSRGSLAFGVGELVRGGQGRCCMRNPLGESVPTLREGVRAKVWIAGTTNTTDNYGYHGSLLHRANECSRGQN